jgi:hypothetical protein
MKIYGLQDVFADKQKLEKNKEFFIRDMSDENALEKVATFVRDYDAGHVLIAAEYEDNLDEIKEYLRDFIKRYSCEHITVSYLGIDRVIVAVPIESGIGDPLPYLDMELNSAQNKTWKLQNDSIV